MPETGKFQIQTPETGNISYLKSGKKREKKNKKTRKICIQRKHYAEEAVKELV